MSTANLEQTSTSFGTNRKGTVAFVPTLVFVCVLHPVERGLRTVQYPLVGLAIGKRAAPKGKAIIETSGMGSRRISFF